MKRANFEFFFSYFCADLNLQRYIMTISFTMSDVPTIFNQLKNQTPNTSHPFAIMKIEFQTDELALAYKNRIEAHNQSIFNNSVPDAGFDVLTPNQHIFDQTFHTKFIDMGIKTEMYYCDTHNNTLRNCGFQVHPRSSISKTPLMLANHTGIIDAGYRGSIIGAFRSLPTQVAPYVVEQYTRLVQICHPTLCPILIVVADRNSLSETQRGAGGFGSTGL